MLSRDFLLPNAVYIFLAIFLAGFLFKLWGKSKSGRQKIDSAKLKLPIVGDISRKTAIARFSRTLGTLVTSGVPILQALNITRDTAGNVVVSSAIDKVKEGESIVTPLQATNVFPAMMISMVDVGEETGQLPEMLLKVADVYDDEVDNSVTALTSILEPIMIVFLALVVGAVVFALFLPLIQIITKVGNA
jgi:type IV pilus assembly protein PilC